MAEFALPKNSKIIDGKRFPAPAGAKNVRTFKIIAGHLMMTRTLIPTRMKLIWIVVVQWYWTR